jgi:hypothetical protein
VQATFGKLPLSFETNRGQSDSRVRFLARGAGYTFFLTQTEAVIDLRQPARRPDRDRRSGTADGAPPTRGAVVRMRLAGANTDPSVAGLDQRPGRENYYVGSLPLIGSASASRLDGARDGRTGLRRYEDVPTYGRVRYEAVYPGVDLVYYGNQRQIEYDLVVAPGTDPGVIRLQFDGADAVEVDSQGELVLKIPGGEVRQHKPVIYQEVAGVRKPVAGGYALTGLREASFVVGEYDRSKPLVLDPVLSYATFLGGNDTEYGYGIAVDSAGCVYVTGLTQSADFPLTDGTSVSSTSGTYDLFITKLTSTGTALVYSTHYADQGAYNEGLAIAVDAAGSAYVAGMGSGNHAMLLRLDPAGSALYGALLGNGGNNKASGIAIDGTGYAYLAGSASPAFDVTPGAYQTTSGGGDDAFVAKVNTNVDPMTSLVYSTFLGGALTDEGYKIAIDGEGNAYVTGSTFSPSFPVTAGGYQTTHGGGLSDAFVSVLSADGSTLLYSTFLGGDYYEAGWGIGVDGSGSVYVGGYAEGEGFPTTAGSFQPAWSYGNCAVWPELAKPCSDGFVAKISPWLSGAASLVYSTYLGGSGSDAVKSLVVDATGNVYVAGKALSPQLGNVDFPMVNPVPGFTFSNADGFVAQLNTLGSALVFSSYYQEVVSDLAVRSGSVYLTGSTYLTSLLGTSGSYQPANRGGQDAFVAKIDGLVAGHAPGPGDYDGDGRPDVAVYRPSTGTWFWLKSSTSNQQYDSRGWGLQAQADVPVPGDYDGDGVNDPTVFRPATGTWFILESHAAFTTWSWFGWGTATDTLMPGDYDADRRTDAAVYRPSEHKWYIRPSNGAAPWSVVFGQTGDVPLAGDFDGDGRRDPAVYRPSSGTWFWLKSSANFTAYDSRGWGLQAQGDVPAPGDYDGDGKTDPCVFRPGTGSWFILESHAAYTTWNWFGWGTAGDQVVPADYDGDGKTDAAVYRTATGTWHIRPSGGAVPWSVVFGQSLDVPLTATR